MSDNNITERRYTDEDEISLVDLVAVLVRYRGMIVGGTILVFVAAVAILFGPGALGLADAPDDNYTVTREFNVRTVPEVLENGVTLDLSTRVRSLLDDPRVVGRAYSLIEQEPDPDLTPAQYNTMIQDEVIGEILTVNYTDTTHVLRLFSRWHDPDAAATFLDELVRLVEEDMARLLEPMMAEAEARVANRIEGTRAALREMIADAVTTDAAGSPTINVDNLMRYLNRTLVETFAEEMDMADQLRRMRDRPGTLREIGEPLVTVRRAAQGRAVRVVVSTMAALFLLIFIAFVRQYIRTVRSDEDEVRKLREAWERK